MYGYFNYSKLTLSDILDKFSEIEIFQIVIKETIHTTKGAKYLAPYRYDNKPSCFFKYFNNKLYFCDFTLLNPKVGCIDIIMMTLGLNFDKTLEYIVNYFNSDIKVNKVTSQIKVDFERPVISIKKKVKEVIKDKSVSFITKDFNLKDKNFWSKYGITKSNLEEDKVYSITHYLAKDSENNFYTIYAKENMYCYTNFDSGNVKIYRPFESKHNKWFTNCTKDDVGGISNLIDSSLLVITKSYKDFRVIKNQGYNSIWFQNEGMIPNLGIIKTLIARFNDIVIWFDNDETGIKNGTIICDYINSLQNSLQTVKLIYLPIELLSVGIKDASDFISKKGKDELNQIINNLINGTNKNIC